MEQKGNNPQNKKPGNEKRPKSNILVSLIIAIAIVVVISTVYNIISGSQYTQTKYSDFLEAMEDNNLAEVQLQYDRIIYLTKEEAAKPAAEQKACYTGLPTGADTLALSDKLHDMGIEVSKKIVEDNSFIMMILYYGVMIGGGNLDSMVAHYTAAKKRRSEDFYSPGKKMGLRPDRPTIVYANRAREAFPDTPIVVLTPFSHGITRYMERQDLSLFEYVFCWLGNTELLLSIIKLMEDKMNLDHDIREGGVQMILLVEDSIRFYSSVLPKSHTG